MSSEDSPPGLVGRFSPTDAEDSDAEGNVLMDRHNEPLASLNLSPVYATSNAEEETLESVSDPGDDVFNGEDEIGEPLQLISSPRFKGAPNSHRFPAINESSTDFNTASFEALEKYKEKPPFG
uniref:Uncharacterized protein n=1 Tax=Ditylenchus dipsaci TaxID=166011 RepID=A0A915DDA8_9BILA